MEKISKQLHFVVEDKGNVVETMCMVPDPLSLTLVKLDIKQGEETRYRMRIEDGVEGRISRSASPHYQASKLHNSSSIYVVHKGWIAILTGVGDARVISVGIANKPGQFYVEAPGSEWYVAYLSKDVVFTYSSSDTETGKVREHVEALPSEDEMLLQYSRRQGISIDSLMQDISRSFGSS